MQNIAVGFQDVDTTNASDFFFRFLDSLDRNDTYQAYKKQMLDLLGIKEGHHILDVGCGIGNEVERLARIVGSNGLVVGVDKSDAMIREAKRRAESLNLPIKYQESDADQLEFPDNTFDSCRAERLFMYLANPKEALAEMIRVVRPGGAIAIFDFYHDGTFFDSPNQALNRTIARFVSEHFPIGYIGVKLPAMFQDLGLTEISVMPHTVLSSYEQCQWIYGGILDKAAQTGAISKSELAQWWNELEKADKAGRFFSGVPGFIISGRKTK